MSKLISEILDSPRTSLAIKIDELERLSGKPGLDIRLAGELKRLYKQKAGLLGLDEDDTSPKELYFAMKNHVFDSNTKLEKIIGVEPDDSTAQMVGKSVKFVEKRLGKKKVWAVKASTGRKQLKANPPKKLMKIFKIRSIDSALKRESPGLFYCFAGLVEGKAWRAKHAAQSAKMTSSDFDYIKINVSVLDATRREQLEGTGLSLNRIIYSDQESAHIEICLPEKRFKGDTLFIVDSLVHRLKLIMHRAEYYKSQSLKIGFTDKLGAIRSRGFQDIEDPTQPFGWAALMHGSTELGINGLIGEHEPYISAEELLVPSLAQIVNFDFWKHPYGMYHDSDIIVSFNLSDMIINAVNEIPPEKAYINHGRTSLQKELYARYLQHEPVKAKAVGLNLAGV